MNEEGTIATACHADRIGSLVRSGAFQYVTVTTIAMAPIKIEVTTLN